MKPWLKDNLGQDEDGFKFGDKCVVVEIEYWK